MNNTAHVDMPWIEMQRTHMEASRTGGVGHTVQQQQQYQRWRSITVSNLADLKRGAHSRRMKKTCV